MTVVVSKTFEMHLSLFVDILWTSGHKLNFLKPNTLFFTYRENTAFFFCFLCSCSSSYKNISIFVAHSYLLLFQLGFVSDDVAFLQQLSLVLFKLFLSLKGQHEATHLLPILTEQMH